MGGDGNSKDLEGRLNKSYLSSLQAFAVTDFDGEIHVVSDSLAELINVDVEKLRDRGLSFLFDASSSFEPIIHSCGDRDIIVRRDSYDIGHVYSFTEVNRSRVFEGSEAFLEYGSFMAFTKAKDDQGVWRYSWANNHFLETLGYSEEDFLGKTATDIWVSSKAKYISSLDHAAAGKLGTVETKLWLEVQGVMRHYSISKFSLFSEGEFVGIGGIAVDITDESNTLETMKIQKELGIVLASTSDLDKALSATLENVIKLPQVDCAGVYLQDRKGFKLNLSANLSDEFVDSVQMLSFDSKLGKSILRGHPLYEAGSKDSNGFEDLDYGNEGIKTSALIPFAYEGDVVGCIAVGSKHHVIFSDYVQDSLEAITTQTSGAFVRIQAEDKIQLFGQVDQLSGAFNRTYTLNYIRDYLENKSDLSPDTLMLVDLYGYTIVSQYFGSDSHEATKNLFSYTVDCIREVVGDCVIGRPAKDDDQFMVLLNEMSSESAEKLGRKISVLIGAEPFKYDDEEFDVGCTVGVCEIEHGDDLDRVIESINEECGALKRGSFERVSICTMSDKSRDTSDDYFRKTSYKLVQGNFFEVHGMPIVSDEEFDFAVEDKKYSHVELLIRGAGNPVIQPYQFLPFVEAYRLMPEVDAFVLEFAIDQLRHTPARQFSVNMHAQSFGYGLDVKEALIVHANNNGWFDMSRLTLEITEQGIIDSEVEKEALGFANRMRDLGVNIAMDDFGTGYSSLYNLHTMPIDILKIDQKFISKLRKDENMVNFIETICLLGKGIGATITAEGIESAAPIEFLRKCGVSNFQGYYFQKPIPYDEIMFIDS